ncbi:molybdate ABC transporter substrate-binding protein [Phenylobacterium soli]|uniref:Molybdate ABC transporter substrate-binding protein n=1 Tax=Phenylobacterium soli TaxID=2170551 RepID=A0A328AL45_9CAUL|nr:molybdate ABC transporter substrate-binding protein [Phenylobacterium soli]RAK54746.1 molybdate ABC transporter substrate-binding protein [Phenylobacterium soli]
MKTFAMLLAALALELAGRAPARAAEPAPVVAAAADLSGALPQVAAAFERQSHRPVKLVFGSSGAFTQQILAGAPFQLFLSADEAYVARLAQAGRTEDPGALYAVGRIGLFVPYGSRLKADGSLKDLIAASADGRLRKFAIANPEHAPYGRAAVQALQHAGAWSAVEGKLVLGENVAQATQFAASGAAEGGVIPLSLALTPAVKAKGRFVLLPAEWHAPLRQRAALIKGAGPTARAFYAYLQGPQGRAILARYGFSVPK